MKKYWKNTKYKNNKNIKNKSTKILKNTKYKNKNNIKKYKNTIQIKNEKYKIQKGFSLLDFPPAARKSGEAFDTLDSEPHM